MSKTEKSSGLRKERTGYAGISEYEKSDIQRHLRSMSPQHGIAGQKIPETSFYWQYCP